MKDWSGDYNSIYRTLGASSHTDHAREEDDFYATDPRALELLLQKEDFSTFIWEPACGAGHLRDVLVDNGYNVRCSDIKDRGCESTEILDFLSVDPASLRNQISRDIITNPPYKYATEFVTKALDISMDSTKIAMFLKLQFLEGKERYKLFRENPPKKIYVFSSRIACALGGDFYQRNADGSVKVDKKGNPLTIGSAVCYAWFIWEKGYKGNTTIDWIIDNES